MNNEHALIEMLQRIATALEKGVILHEKSLVMQEQHLRMLEEAYKDGA